LVGTSSWFVAKKMTGIKWIAEIHDPLVIRSSPADNGFGTPRNRDARFRKYLEKILLIGPIMFGGLPAEHCITPKFVIPI